MPTNAEDPAEHFRFIAEHAPEARATFADDDAYRTALAEAWRWAESDPRATFAQQIRCALIASSLHTRTRDLPPALIVALVYAQRWSLADAFAQIARTHDVDDRAQTLARLAQHALIPPEAYPTALASARTLANADAQASALCAFAAHLPNALQPEALAAARALDDADARAVTLATYAAHAPAELQPTLCAEAFASAHTLTNPVPRARTLTTLARTLPETFKPEAVERAFAAVHAITHDVEQQIEALAELTPLLSEQHLAQAFQLTQTFPPGYSLHTALLALAPLLTEELLPQACALAEQCKLAYETEIHLLTFLKSTHRIATLSVKSARDRGHASYAIASATLDDAFMFIGEIKNMDDRAHMLVAVAAQHNVTSFADLVAATQQFCAQRWWQARQGINLLTVLIRMVTDNLQTQVVAEAHALITRGQYIHPKSLEAFIQTLQTELAPPILSAIRAWQQTTTNRRTTDRIITLLAELALIAPAPLNQQALDDALAGHAAIHDAYARLGPLSALATALPAPFTQQLFAEILPFANEDQQHLFSFYAASMIHPLLPNELRSQSLMARAETGPVDPLTYLTLSHGFADGFVDSRVLNSLYTSLSQVRVDEHPPATLDLKELIAEQILNPAPYEAYHARPHACALIALARTLPAERRHQVSAQALTVARTIPAALAPANILSALSAVFPDALQGEALTAALAAAATHNTTDYYRALDLAAFAPALPDALKPQARAAADTLATAEQRTLARAAIALTLPPAQKANLLARATADLTTIADSGARTHALVAIATARPDHALSTDLLAIARALPEADYKAYALAVLVPALPPALQPRVIAEAFNALNRHTQATGTRGTLMGTNTLCTLLHVWHTLDFVPLPAQARVLAETLHATACCVRTEAFNDLITLTPLIVFLGGPPAAEAVYHAINDVTRWWP